MATSQRPPRAALLAILALAMLLAGCTAGQRVEQKLAQLSGLVGEARGHIQAYEAAMDDAELLRAAIAEELGAGAASALLSVDERIARARAGYAEAVRLLDQVGPPPGLPVEATAELEARLDEQIAVARQAVLAGETYLADLRAIRQMFAELADEWVRDLLWFEVDGYWVSEEDEFAAYNVCYYGERFSHRAEDGEAAEVIISDLADRGGGLFGSDQAGVDWQFFTVEDYINFVNNGIVAAAPYAVSSDTQAGEYLCGRSPQTGEYGALGEPTVTIEKAYGSMRAELSDEGSSFVGDTRYGEWCQVAADGSVQSLAEVDEEDLPADAQWCWHQKPGSSTGYYWERRRVGGSFIYIQSHRRCLYCAPNSAWSGGASIPDGQLAAINQTGGAGLRGPFDQGGGPGTGK